MAMYIIIIVVLVILKILFWIAVCARISARRQQRVIVQRNVSVRCDQIEGQPGQLVQMPSGQIVRVNSTPDANMQPPPYHPGQAGMMPYSTPDRPVDNDPRVGISPKVGLVDQA